MPDAHRPVRSSASVGPEPDSSVPPVERTGSPVEPAVAVERVAVYHGLLGTVIEIRVEAADERAAEEAERWVVEEIRRLEGVFSVYDQASTLARWRRGALDDPGPELGLVLATALHWQTRSGGAFHPLTGLVTAAYRRAAEAGVAPTGDELDKLARAIQEPRYRIGPNGPERTGDCTALDLNALAKGWIVDQVGQAVELVPGIAQLVVNAGGDLAHRGRGSVRVGIENPHRPFDNEAPLVVVEVANAALATTGGARRGISIGGQWLSHVLDPRTARPVAHTASATVLAPDAATADVVATVAGVLPLAEAMAFVDGLDLDLGAVACLLVDADGGIHTSRRWPGPTTT